jgi:hypothetical protein
MAGSQPAAARMDFGDRLDQRILKPCRWKFVLLAFFSLVFVTVGIDMIGEGNAAGWLVAIGFGAATVAFAVMGHPRSGFLRLEPDRFTVCSLFRVSSYRWKDIEAFDVVRFGISKLVAFTLAGPPGNGERAPKLAAVISGYDSALPDTYGMKAEKLALLLNEWRLRAR